MPGSPDEQPGRSKRLVLSSGGHGPFLVLPRVRRDSPDRPISSCTSLRDLWDPEWSFSHGPIGPGHLIALPLGSRLFSSPSGGSCPGNSYSPACKPDEPVYGKPPTSCVAFRIVATTISLVM